jgi:hypothetical protein
MNAYLRVFSLLLLVSVCALAAVPRVTSVEPDFGKPGEVLVANGQSLGAGSVTKLFLTLGNDDHEVEIKEQSDELIRFAIPAKLGLGRYNLTIQTGGPTPAILVQPITCSVVDEEGARKMAESAKEEVTIVEQKEEEQPAQKPGEKKDK